MKKITALDIIEKIELEVERQPSSHESMLNDVKMMQFKIRPLTGDISILDSLDETIIKSLWRIGKIDEIISKVFFDMEPREKESLLGYLQSEELRTQNEIRNGLNKTKKTNIEQKDILKIEVFKEYDKKPSIH